MRVIQIIQPHEPLWSGTGLNEPHWTFWLKPEGHEDEHQAYMDLKSRINDMTWEGEVTIFPLTINSSKSLGRTILMVEIKATQDRDAATLRLML